MKFILFIFCVFFVFSCDSMHSGLFPDKKKEIFSLKNQVQDLEAQVNAYELKRREFCKKRIKRELGNVSLNDARVIESYGEKIIFSLRDKKDASIVACIFDQKPKLQILQDI